MKAFRSTLAIKLTIANFVLLLLLAAAQYYLISNLWRRGIREQDQRFNWELAHEFARELRPVLEPSIDVDRLEPALARLITLNPIVDIAIVDLDGWVILVARAAGREVKYLEDGEKQVDVEKIEEFFKIDPYRRLPLYGTGLRKPLKRAYRPWDDRIFSAAKILYGDQPTYLYIVLESSRQVFFRESMETFYIYKGGIVTSFLLFIIAGSIGLLTMSRITRRFRRMTTDVRKIANGDLDILLQETGNDEITDLATSINKMTHTIIENMQTVAEADRQRKEMIANLSHDIGSPLAAIQSHTELMVDRQNVTKEDLESFLKMLHRNSHSLTRLVSDLLALAKIEARELQPVLEAVPIAEMLSEEIIPKLSPLAVERGVQLITELQDNNELVVTDYSLLNRVLCNLIENAIFYNKPDGKVIVSLSQMGNNIQISVADAGVGISEVDANRIFEKFYRSDKARSKSTGGSGLGLWIVKSILETLGTTIRYSPSPDGGSVFKFELPIQR